MSLKYTKTDISIINNRLGRYFPGYDSKIDDVDDSIGILDDPTNLADGVASGWILDDDNHISCSLKDRKKRYEKESRYIEDLFGSSIITGIIVKVIPSDDGNTDYREKTGKDFLKEKTLIFGDENFNIFLVFKEEKSKVKTNRIANTVHIMGKYEFNKNTIIHKMEVPAKVPAHLMDHLVFYNNSVVDNIVYNSSGVGSNRTSPLIGVGGGDEKTEVFVKNRLEFASKKEEKFFTIYYKKEEGGMCSWKEMKKHPEWKDEYKNNLEIQGIQMCLSCGKQSKKDCCPNYSGRNRSVKRMVIGYTRQG